MPEEENEDDSADISMEIYFYLPPARQTKATLGSMYLLRSSAQGRLFSLPLCLKAFSFCFLVYFSSRLGVDDCAVRKGR